MSYQTALSKIKKTVHLSTNTEKACEECRFQFNDWHDIARQINHYIEHGYKLLHVGAETTRDDSGGPWHSTVAIVGK